MYPFSITLYIYDGGIKGLSPKYNGLDQLLEWFILPVLLLLAVAGIRAASSSPWYWRTQGSTQMAGWCLRKAKVLK